MAVHPAIVLEPSAQGIVDATADTAVPLRARARGRAPGARGPAGRARSTSSRSTRSGSPCPAAVGDARVRIIKPAGRDRRPCRSIVYMHGGGWILGNAATHDRLVRELAVGAHAALLFVEYPNSPEARYPVAIEQGYATAQWVVREGATKGLDATRMAVAGESVGGNMAAALTLMAKQRGDVTFVQPSMYYPVTDAAMDTASYDEFAEGYYLTPQGDGVVLGRLHHRPRRARRDHRLTQPGHARAARAGCRRPCCSSTRPTRCATRARRTPPSSGRRRGVTTVRYDGVVHDFMLLNAMRDAHATRAAIEQAVAFLRRALGTDADDRTPPTSWPRRSSAPSSNAMPPRSRAARSSRS